MNLYIVRHGQTQWNVENRILGRTDLPLTQTGRAQARALADSLRETPIDIIYTSPLERACDTARAIAAERNIPLYQSVALIEHDFGIYEGLPRDDAQYQADKRNLLTRYPEGESFLDLAARVYSFLNYLREYSSAENVLLVGHNGICRIIHSYFYNMGQDEFVHYAADNCSVARYELTRRADDVLDVLTPDGDPAGRTELRSLAHHNGNWHASIHMWVVNEADGRILLQRRSGRKESYPRMLDAPAAGHVDAGETPAEAAIRESREELALRLAAEQVEYVGRHPLIIEHPERGFISNEWNYIYLTRGDYASCPPIPDELEIESLDWYTADEINAIYEQNPDDICIGIDEWTMVRDFLCEYL